MIKNNIYLLIPIFEYIIKYFFKINYLIKLVNYLNIKLNNKLFKFPL
jgi:hypothetical protein